MLGVEALLKGGQEERKAEGEGVREKGEIDKSRSRQEEEKSAGSGGIDEGLTRGKGGIS